MRQPRRVDDQPDPGSSASPDAIGAPAARRGLGRREMVAGIAGVLAGGAVGSAAGVAAGYRFSPALRSVELGVRSPELALPEGVGAFRREAEAIVARHRAQTTETVAALKAKYEAAVFGRVRVWDLVEKLALCIDPSDMRLFVGSQFLHLQQILAGMEANGVDDPDMLLLAIVHDLGKVLLLARELPEHVVCTTGRIGSPDPGCGLDEVVFQFGHGEFIYSRLRGHVPDHVAWTARYHNVRIDDVEPFMSDRDRLWCDRYLRPFRRFDAGFASAYYLPRLDLDRYRELVERAFPSPLLV
jgi:hypothetical protein